MYILLGFIVGLLIINYVKDNALYKCILNNVVHKRIKAYRLDENVSSICYDIAVDDLPKCVRKRIKDDIEDFYFPNKFIKRIMNKINREVWFDDNGSIKGVYVQITYVNEDSMVITFSASIRKVTFKH